MVLVQNNLPGAKSHFAKLVQHMRNIARYAAFLFLVMATGCENKPTQPPSNLGIPGRIEGWQSYGNDNLYLAIAMPYSTVILDSTPIGADGSFFLKTPLPTPPDSTLRMFVAHSDSSEDYFSGMGVRVQIPMHVLHLSHFSCTTIVIYPDFFTRGTRMPQQTQVPMSATTG
jgi:hypothetical protein